MLRKLLLPVAASVALFCVPITAYPAATEISGTYAVSVSQICQSAQSSDTYGVSVTPGLINYQWWIADFNKKTGIMTQVTVTSVQGSLIVPNAPSNLTQQTFSPVSNAYSNTATTFTLGGSTYNVVYGLVIKGVAETFMFGGIPAGQTIPSCALSATAIRTNVVTSGL